MSVRRTNGGFLGSDNHPMNQQNSKQQLELIGGSDLFHHQNPPGLARYRSAPSSFLGTLLDSSTTDESEALFSAIWDGSRDLNHKGCQSHHDSSSSSSSSQLFHKHETSTFSSGLNNGGGGGGSYSVGMESQVQNPARVNTGNGIAPSNSNLARQNSSPAGFFNGFGVKGGGEVVATATHNHNHLSYSSCPSSSPRMMPSIPENRSIDNRQTRNGGGGNRGEYEAHDAWSEPSLFSDLKRDRDGNLKMLSTCNHHSGEAGKSSTSGLVHHLSLPKNTNEKLKFLQFERDVVSCQIRAKRGCATHPRSIAERMRRTRISERMKKLQELFPKMDKQTSTADMLGLAVQYIKDLQMQVQTLTETKAKCICLPKPK